MQRRPAVPAAALAAALFWGVCGPAEAQRRPEGPREESVQSRPAGVPLMAVVALSNQRVTIYDAEGRILRAPVSTGRTGYETPAGIYSVIQKSREHYSNLYDDAEMPFMQRITWSGIALHAGQLPGHPASHGCIRLPYGFAENLFELTRMGMRVVIVRDDMSPIEITHPALFKPGPIRPEVAVATPAAADTRAMRLGATEPAAGAQRTQTWRAIAAAKAAEAAAATKRAEDARRAVAKIAPEGARLAKKQRLVEGAKLRAEAQLKDTERALEEAGSPEQKQSAEEAKAKVLERLAVAQAELDAFKAEAQPTLDAVAAAREVVKAAEAAREAAVNEARLAEVKIQPVSVFISRKTQRLYIRQGFQPVFDSPVTIGDPEAPIGTTIFTALNYLGEGADLRWSALAMYPSAANPAAAAAPRSQRGAGPRQAEPASTDARAAKAALERISIPQDAIERVSEVVSPGSSLIISDEGLSRETGKGTDFVVLMSGEPQGGIKTRRRMDPYAGAGYGRPYRRSPYGMNPFSFW